MREGKVNIDAARHSKSYWEIFRDNLLTLFNLVNLILGVLIALTGSWKNMLFLGVVLGNIAIGVFQEIRTKRTLDKISVVVAQKASVLRDGCWQEIPIEQIVLNDVLCVRTGMQIPSDGVVIAGELEVDESLLTGESVAVAKATDSQLFSGSFVTSGEAYMEVTCVGAENYAARITQSAKKYRKHPSQLRDSINRIIKDISIVLLPLGIMLFCKQYFLLHAGLTPSILSMSAALIGMIPEGLVILTSIALATGVVQLARKRTLVQELYCIETLARVDTLCLDKTGTLTEGNMQVIQLVSLGEKRTETAEEILRCLSAVSTDDNATARALHAAYPASQGMRLIKKIDFSSQRKYSGAVFEEGTYLIGAHEFMGCQEEELHALAQSYAKQGYRVLTLAQCEGFGEDGKAIEPRAMALVLLADCLRESAAKTLEYFAKQGVALKIISGDDPVTVSEVARRAGLCNAQRYVDATTLRTEEDLRAAVQEYTVFGRVTPEQKKQMVCALKQQGHIVGMTGDGVNDVLAFKEADISIAMASGSDVAKSTANLVLLDSNFDALPAVLNEGRRVINNIQRVATLFLTKTAYSVALSFCILVLPFVYPFVPIHLTFVSSLTIGIPAFFMALEPNYRRLEGDFLKNVVKISLPSAVGVMVCILYVFLISLPANLLPAEISHLCVITIALNGLLVLTKVARPLTLLRGIVLVAMTAGTAIGFVCFRELLSMPPHFLWLQWPHVCVICLVLWAVPRWGGPLISRMARRLGRRRAKEN